MSKNLDMEIVHHPPKMRSVVNLIIALERMKADAFECRDEDLLSFMLESIVEGERVQTKPKPKPPQKKNKKKILPHVGLE